jgi:hypothetical protein
VEQNIKVFFRLVLFERKEGKPKVEGREARFYRGLTMV